MGLHFTSYRARKGGDKKFPLEFCGKNGRR
jgi:hypothetical protein